MRSMQRAAELRHLLVASGSFFLLGAAGCLAIPIRDEEPELFPDADLEHLEGASRNDVVNRWGEPNWRFDDYRIFAYDGLQYLGKVYWGYVIPGGFGGVGDAGVLPHYERHLLLIAFDENGKVAAHAVQKPSPLSNSMHHRVEEWSEEQRLERADLEFAVPPKRSGVVFYRPRRFWDTGMFDADVSVNGVSIGRVEEGTYLPIVIDPGRHDLHFLVRDSYGKVADRSETVDAAVTVKPGETAHILLGIRHGTSKPWRVKVERRPELEARDKLGELAPVSPPPAYAGW